MIGLSWRGSVASEGDGDFVLRPVVFNAGDPKPDQAKLGTGCLAAQIDAWTLLLELLQHRVFNDPGQD